MRSLWADREYAGDSGGFWYVLRIRARSRHARSTPGPGSEETSAQAGHSQKDQGIGRARGWGDSLSVAHTFGVVIWLGAASHVELRGEEGRGLMRCDTPRHTPGEAKKAAEELASPAVRPVASKGGPLWPLRHSCSSIVS